ncbi:glycosyltransferase family 2 protein [uncultured Algibacter sp.]|uniref:glycosyltransferase family 2 protein n=1 Tax=uncultured Algibacter sp. TaxID=298659 RepID=UPI0026161558|nr:glycosyltransferase family 2 protein [uncultured Algibacter sp.]
MQLSVVILNYNVRYFLELCLKSVEQAIQGIDAEIIVVDNNSKDGSCEMVKTLFPNVKLIANTENCGFSKGNNIGVLSAQGEYLCVLNPDTVVAEDTFYKVLEFVKSKDNLGIVGCKLIDGRGAFLPESKRKIPYVKAAFKKLIGNTDDYYANNINSDGIGEVPVLVGAFMFLKKSVYIEIEGFDEDYFMYGEDIDISYKALKFGYSNYYFGETTVIHFKGESTLRDKNYAKRFYGAMQIFYKKHFKKNVFFDFFVWIGIKLIPLIRKSSIQNSKNVSAYIYVSSKLNPNMMSVLNEDMVLKQHLVDIGNLEDETELVFDANVIKYKEIIEFMDTNYANMGKLVTYKIQPKASNFILGSDNSVSRGEVVVF